MIFWRLKKLLLYCNCIWDTGSMTLPWEISLILCEILLKFFEGSHTGSSNQNLDNLLDKIWIICFRRKTSICWPPNNGLIDGFCLLPWKFLRCLTQGRMFKCSLNFILRDIGGNSIWELSPWNLWDLSVYFGLYWNVILWRAEIHCLAAEFMIK